MVYVTGASINFTNFHGIAHQAYILATFKHLSLCKHVRIAWVAFPAPRILSFPDQLYTHIVI